VLYGSSSVQILSQLTVNVAPFVFSEIVVNLTPKLWGTRERRHFVDNLMANSSANQIAAFALAFK